MSENHDDKFVALVFIPPNIAIPRAETPISECCGSVLMQPDVYEYARHRVNACAGMADPAAEITQLRKDAATLAREVEAWRKAEHLRINEPHNEFATRADARAATDASGALARHKEATP